MIKKFTDEDGDKLVIRLFSVTNYVNIGIVEHDDDHADDLAAHSVAFKAEDMPDIGPEIALAVLDHVSLGNPDIRPGVSNNWDMARKDATSAELLWMIKETLAQYQVQRDHDRAIAELEAQATKRQDRYENVARAIYGALDATLPWDDLDEPVRCLFIESAKAAETVLQQEDEK